jgi:hypothetical protein
MSVSWKRPGKSTIAVAHEGSDADETLRDHVAADTTSATGTGRAPRARWQNRMSRSAA